MLKIWTFWFSCHEYSDKLLLHNLACLQFAVCVFSIIAWLKIICRPCLGIALPSRNKWETTTSCVRHAMNMIAFEASLKALSCCKQLSKCRFRPSCETHRRCMHALQHQHWANMSEASLNHVGCCQQRLKCRLWTVCNSCTKPSVHMLMTPYHFPW